MTRPSADPRFGADDVRLGQVSGQHGILGEVKVFLYNPASELVDGGPDGLPVTLVSPDGARQDVLLQLRPGAGRRILARIEGVEDREAAAALQGYEIVVSEAALPVPGEGEWYHRDLVGLPVRTVSGRELGRIAEIHSTGEVDVWVLRGKGERVLPALKKHLVEVRVRPVDGQEAGVIVTEDAVDERPPL